MCDIDPEATHCFVTPQLAKKCGIEVNSTATDVELGDGSSVPTLGQCITRIEVCSASSTELVYILEMQHADFVIGRSWLRKHNPVIDWNTAVLQLEDEIGSCGATPSGRV